MSEVIKKSFEEKLKEKAHTMSVLAIDRKTRQPNPLIALKLEEMGSWARSETVKEYEELIKSANKILMWLKRMEQLEWDDDEYSPNFKRNYKDLEEKLEAFRKGE